MVHTFIETVKRFLPSVRFRSVQTRLVLLFSLAFTVVVVVLELAGFFGIPCTRYGGTLGQHRLEARRSLNLVADLKEERLRLWLSERREDLLTLTNHLLHVSRLQSLCATVRQPPTGNMERDELVARLRVHPDGQALARQMLDVRKMFVECERIIVADAETGLVLVSTDEADPGDDLHGRRWFSECVRASEHVEDVHVAEERSGLALGISGLVHGLSGEPLAVVAMEIRVDDVLQSIVHTGEGLGETGEALLVNSEQRNLTPLKHPLPDGTQPGPLGHRLMGRPATLAAHGQSGSIESDDYRGLPVLAVYRHIPVAPGVAWGLVVKRDQAELFESVRRDALASLAIGLFGIAGVVLLTIAVARTVTRPVRELEQAARAVAQGDFTARVPVDTADEIGSLAAIFNGMIAQVQRDRETVLRHERLAAIGQLTATVSHEIRNPLGTIRTSFFVLAERLRGKDAALEPLLSRVGRSIDRCDTIISDLLDYSRMRNLDLKSTDIDAWLEVTLSEYEVPAGIALQRNLDSNARLDIDRERLHRCIINLLANACQAMEPGGGEVTVNSHCRQQRLVISVVDTGCGIPEDSVERAFEPLYSTKPFGVGLGLPIVKQIVQQHGGNIALESKVGQGTTVTLWLPLPVNQEIVDG